MIIVSRIHKELLQINIKRCTTEFKNGNKIKSIEDIKMAENHMKKGFSTTCH
jgi:hypothetical protein